MLAIGNIAPAIDIATDTESYILAPHDGKDGHFLFEAPTPLAALKIHPVFDLIEDFTAADAK